LEFNVPFQHNLPQEIRFSTMNVKGWLEFNVPFQHKYGYIGDEMNAKEIAS